MLSTVSITFKKVLFSENAAEKSMRNYYPEQKIWIACGRKIQIWAYVKLSEKELPLP